MRHIDRYIGSRIEPRLESNAEPRARTRPGDWVANSLSSLLTNLLANLLKKASSIMLAIFTVILGRSVPILALSVARGSRPRRPNAAFLGLFFLALNAVPAAQALIGDTQQQLTPLRAEYRAALEAAKTGNWDRFEDHYGQLANYPLRAYLDYERLLAQRYRIGGSEARRFVEANGDSPLGLRYLGHYLSAAGAQRRWEDYLAATVREPRSESLRCYYHRAKLDAGERAVAFDGAARLWLSGRSVDDACDPLFTAWRSAEGINEDLIWQRALLAYNSRQSTLLRYIASLASGTLAADLEVLRRSYREPQRTLRLVQNASPARRGEILTQGLVRFSRYDPARALAQYRALPEKAIDPQQSAALESAIALRGLIERDPGVRDWVDSKLPRWQDDRLTELRLRWTLAEQDWPAFLEAIRPFSSKAAAQPDWLYWRARALEATGGEEAAQLLYAEAAKSRSYYGFLSADRIGMPYMFNEQTVQPMNATTLPLPAQQLALRVNELTVLEADRDAHAEWNHTLPRLEQPVQQQLAVLAAEQGWYRFAIDAANESRSWDALSLRFPLAYTDVFREPAAGNALPVSELMAIARRESAFFPAARSSAGARGLMQLLPATGLGLAKKQGIPLSTRDLYSIEKNVSLGSAYYRQLLERFDGNRAVALAAYNAGPNRVKHWVGKGLPIDAWIETIPYRETRDYVKAVLAYSVVFDHRMGQEARLLTAAERQGVY